MRVPKTPADPPKVADSKRPPAYINENTHWWDGSHVYGSSPSAQASLRAGREGKVLVSPSGRLGVDPVTGREITGFTENGGSDSACCTRCSRSSTTPSATS